MKFTATLDPSNPAQEFRVYFRHHPDQNPSTTTAFIKITGQEMPFKNAVAKCNPIDVFCKETGRKVAMTKLLKDFEKPFRTIAWTAYLNRGQENAPKKTQESSYGAGAIPPAYAVARRGSDDA